MLNYFFKKIIYVSFITNNLIKPIRQEIFYYYYENRHLFKQTACVVLDNNIEKNTRIKFVPTITKKEFTEKKEWLYLLTIDNLIVQIDSTENGLQSCSEKILKSPAKNQTISTLEYYLQKNSKVKMYGYSLPSIIKEIEVLNKKINVSINSCEVYKKVILDDFKSIYKNYPLLN